MAARDVDTAGRADVAGVGEYHLGGQDAGGEGAARAVEIGEHRVEQPGALHEAGFQDVPVGGRDQQRKGIQRPGPGNGGFLIAAGIAIAFDFAVGDALVVDEATDHGPHLIQSCPAALADQVAHLLPDGPDLAGIVEELVVSGQSGHRRGGLAATQLEQSALGAGCPVAAEELVGVLDGLTEVRIDGRRHLTSRFRRWLQAKIAFAPDGVRAATPSVVQHSTHPA